MKAPKTPDQIRAKIEELEKLQKNVHIKDHSLFCEYEGKIQALKWALGERGEL